MSARYVTIRGNHDRQLLDRPVEEMGASDQAAYSQLNGRHRAWLQSLPAILELEPGILLCHGTPYDDLEYLLEDVGQDGVHMASAATIRMRLGNIGATLVLCGHSHIPRAISIGNGVQIVNPGSVGLPAYDDVRPIPHYMETGSPHARYALLDRGESGSRISFFAIEYDWPAASEAARLANRPDSAHALATGYALRPGLV